MIELRGVTKRFGHFTAVDDVSLKVEEGEFITLLGPSGCGKTTLLRLIAGFETPDAGRVLLGPIDITHVPPYRRPLNQVFQSYALFPHQSVRENIAFGLRMQRVSKSEIQKRVDEVLGIVSLAGLEDRRPDQISGGQRQRVALARAIVCQPKVLLLDEPLSALDAKLRHQMQLELKRLQRALGITFIFVTHDQEEALTMSDRIALVNNGRIEQIGTASQIYHQPRTKFAADFIGESNLIPGKVAARGEGHTVVEVAGGLSFRILNPNTNGLSDGILLSIRPEKIHVSKRPISDCEMVFEATVEQELFKGAMDELALSSAGGLKLTALVANESAMLEAIHVGDRVYCGIHPDDIVVVQDA